MSTESESRFSSAAFCRSFSSGDFSLGCFGSFGFGSFGSALSFASALPFGAFCVDCSPSSAPA
eukprot:429517-Alexandrium_andersonii.AAC.1